MSAPHYVTNDSYLAAYVLSEGAVLACCRRLGPKRVEFRFEASRHLHELLRLYWSGVSTIVIHARFFSFHERLKSRSFGESKRCQDVRTLFRLQCQP